MHNAIASRNSRAGPRYIFGSANPPYFPQHASMENDKPVECEDRAESGTVDAKDHASIALLEKEVMLCTEARLKLNNVITDKTSSKQCYENERLQHNQLLRRELRLDTERMRIVMRLHRATMRDVSYT